MVTKLDLRAEFHTNVSKLYQKTHEPCEPVNYRGREYVSTENYVFLHEEEQHLADGLAFLAQTKAGFGYVSAVTMEQSMSPPALLVRLASNETPTPKTVNGLRQVLNTVAEYAGAGKGREIAFPRIFDRILLLSRDRLLERIRPSILSVRRAPLRPSSGKTMYLHEKIDILLDSMSSQNLNAGIETLREHLILLQQSLRDVEHDSLDNSIQALKTVVQLCWEVSNIDNAKSLETQLRSLGATDEVHQSRIVLDIDKIGRYLGICKELMRFCRNERTKDLFRSIRLRACTAPPGTEPPGSNLQCSVHGEVQLILHYERSPTKLLPRCIGSSKSACFLCDLFIREHGKYHISHTHKRLYERWTLPEAMEMSSDQVTKLEGILGSMNQELVRQIHIDRPKRFYDNGPESRAHLLVLPDGAYVASPITSVIAQARPPILGAPSTDKAEGSASTLILNTTTPEELPLVSTYRLHNLPFSMPFTKALTSSVLKVGDITYILDFEDVSSGHIQISEHIDETSRRDVLRVNARDPVLDSILSLRDGAEEHMLTFCVHDNNRCELEIVVRWT